MTITNVTFLLSHKAESPAVGSGAWFRQIIEKAAGASK